MIIAFDFHGCLQDLPGLRCLAAALMTDHHSCHVICGIANSADESQVRQIINLWHIDWNGIHFVTVDTTLPPGKLDYAVGLKKLEVMRSIGATMLFDDNPHIVRAVRDGGLMAFQAAK